MSEYCCKLGVSNVKCKGCFETGCPKCIIVYNGYCNTCDEHNNFIRAEQKNYDLEEYIEYLQLLIKDHANLYVKYENKDQWTKEYTKLKDEKDQKMKKKQEEFNDCKTQ